MVRQQLKKVPGLALLHYKLTQQRDMHVWKTHGRPMPPPHKIKTDTVIEYGQKFAALNLVETGTFLGHMVDATKKYYSKIISIELGEDLATDARKRFSKYGYIDILQGDSSRLLPDILRNLSGKTIFWLDAHHSSSVTAIGESYTPILSEITVIAGWDQSLTVLLIDDARLFTGKDYPEMSTFKEFIKMHFPMHEIDITNDIIRVTPRDMGLISGR